MDRRFILRRLLSLLLCLLLMGLAGCKRAEEAPPPPQDQTKHAMTSFYPLYVFALNLTRDVPDLSVSCLVQPQDGCLRSYSLSDWDASVLMGQDVVILGGRGLESFEATLSSISSGPIVLTCMQGLTLEGEGETADDEDSHLVGENPFLYLSTAGAIEISTTLASMLASIDSDYAHIYQANLDNYLTRMDELAARMTAVMSTAPRKKVALLNEGLIYFARQFSLDVAAQVDHEPGVDPSDNELDELLTQLRESGAEVVILEKQAPQHLIDSLTEAGYPVALFDILSTHMADGQADAYETIMLENCQRVARAMLG